MFYENKIDTKTKLLISRTSYQHDSNHGNNKDQELMRSVDIHNIKYNLRPSSLN